MDTERNRHLRALALGLAICVVAPGLSTMSGCRGGSLGPVDDFVGWIVGFAKETGEFVVEKAQVFSDAVAAAWRAFWGLGKVNNVIVDENDPLRGVYDGTLQCRAEWRRTGGTGGEPNEVSIKLNRPRMVRQSPDNTSWELAPEEQDRINVLQNQLMSAT